LEAGQASMSERLADSTIYAKEPAEAQKLSERFAEIDQLLIQSLERWEIIEAKTKS